MTAFIESFATQQLLPPWTAKDAQRWCFVIEMDRERIKTYLANRFNGTFAGCSPAPYRYEPVPGPQFGLISVTQFPDIASSNRTERHPVSGGNAWDRIRHKEVYVAFPVLRYAVTNDGLMHQPRLVWVQPAVYSDNDTIVFSAREIWGTDMFLATINREESEDLDRLHLDVGMIGVKTFDPRSEEQLLPLLHIHAEQTLASDLTQVLQADEPLRRFVDLLFTAGLQPGEAAPDGLDTATYPHGVQINNLKQFRDCYDMGAAIYRAIVASLMSAGNVRNLILYDAAQVDLSFMWSDTLSEFLTTILNIERPSTDGPPRAHEADGGPPSCQHMVWQGMNHVKIETKLAFAFMVDLDFRVLGTLHTYGGVEA